jgi:putative ubiquitin-RnfH superfamily antitoxin RatB of RatAB toxin-antitoxin module
MAERMGQGQTPEATGELNIQCVLLAAGDGGCLLRDPATLRLQKGVRVAEALARFTGMGDAELAALFSGRRVAVFGVTHVLHEGDRIEVLDDLRFDPMESRRRRARHKAEQPQSRRRSGVAPTG